MSQQQGSEIAAGSCPNHNGSGLVGSGLVVLPLGNGGDKAVVRIGAALEVGISAKTGQQFCLCLGIQIQLKIKAVNQSNRLTFAGIHAALHQPMTFELGGRKPQPLAHRKHQFGLAVIEGQFQLT